MADLREEFYAALREDFDDRGAESFLCRWLEAERREDFRLSLKRRRSALEDSPASRQAYGSFLIRSLLDNAALRPLRGKLNTLRPLLCPGAEAIPSRRDLCGLLDRLETGETDPPASLLLALSAELLERCPRPPERADAYAALQERFLDLELGDIREADYLRGALDLLIERDRLRLGGPVRDLLWDYGLRAGGEALFTGLRRNGQKYRRLRELLDRPDLPALGRPGVERVHRALSSAFLTAEAQTFLYDGGQAAQGCAAGRRKDRVMDLLDAYCKENGLALQPEGQGGPAALTPSQRDSCERLYQLLRAGENSRVLVPIQLDPESGAGLYIMGKEFFQDARKIYRSIQGSCCYACFYLCDLTVDEDYGVSFSWSAGEEELGELCGFPNLDEALKWYGFLRRNKALRYYRDLNGAPPPGCPPALRRYFAAPAGGVSLSAEDVRQTEKALAADYAAYARRRSRRKR